jgi:hypothetical protein
MPPAPRAAQRRSRPAARLRTLAACAFAALLLLSALAGLRLHAAAGDAVWLALRRPPRTDQKLLLQHYAARELLFRRGGKRVYFLHIHKARARRRLRGPAAHAR